MHAIGIDIGGTTTRVGIVAGESTLLHVERFETGGDFGALAESITKSISMLFASAGLSKDSHTSVGLAVPGLIQTESGLISRCVNLPFLEGTDPADLVPETLRANTRVLSDAEAATWGEYAALKSQTSRFAHLRLGTGIGCGVIVGGALVDLQRPPNQHPDVLVFDRSKSAAICKCGRRGCLETILASGDPISLETITSGVSAVVENLFTQHGVEVVSLGGGLVTKHPSIVESVRQKTQDSGQIRIQSCLLGDDAGVIGAGILSLKANRRPM